MDVLTSSEFRKRYATLTKPTKVTVSGHVIGTWTPGGLLSYDDIPDVIEKMQPVADPKMLGSFRPVIFTPVPKPAPRKKR